LKYSSYGKKNANRKLESARLLIFNSKDSEVAAPLDAMNVNTP